MTEKRIERHSSDIEDDFPRIYAFIAKDDPLLPNEFLMQLKEHSTKSHGIPSAA